MAVTGRDQGLGQVPVTGPMRAADVTGSEVARQLVDDGYVVVNGMMSDADVQAARADLGRVLEETRTGRNAFEGFSTQRIYALFAKTRTFDQAAVHPLLLDVLDQVLAHYQLSAPVGIRIGPGEKAQILHTDDMIYPIPQPHPPVVVNTMWPLDEFTEENGATRFVAGSHQWQAGRSRPATIRSALRRCRRARRCSTWAASGTAAARTAPAGRGSE